VPLEKEKARLLLQGVASHHAGLLPVYKSLVEELFNANLVKVVFATETLAAGVNMPARSTVITTLSKKLGRTVVKLMPSQVLQMAGRAGRRGKDVQGHVVVMRSRSEDAMDAYELFCSPVDSIRSHFRSSYAMVINILKTRSLESCKLLVERNFGNYLKVFELERELEAEEALLAELQGSLDGVDRGELKLYQRLVDKLDKARRARKDLVREAEKNERKFVAAVINAVRMGSGVLLRDGQSAALVGETSFPHPMTLTRQVFTVLLTQGGQLVAVDLMDVRHVDPAASVGVSVDVAYQLSALATQASGLLWHPEGDMFVAAPAEAEAEESQDLVAFLREVGESIPDVPSPEPSPDLLRQDKLIESLAEQVKGCPVMEGADDILEAFSEVEGLEKRVKKKRKILRGVQQQEWDDFLAAAEVLEMYGALLDNKPTPLGQLVGTVRSENELWASLVLLSDGLADLDGVDLVGVLSALVNDFNKQEVQMKFTASAAAQVGPRALSCSQCLWCVFRGATASFWIISQCRLG
jgi:superfamily II RNA helicase